MGINLSFQLKSPLRLPLVALNIVLLGHFNILLTRKSLSWKGNQIDNDNDNDLFYLIYTCEVFYILKVGTRFQTVT